MSAPDAGAVARGAPAAPAAGSRPRAAAAAVVPGPMTVRVTVADAWRTFALQATPVESAGALKTRALASARIDAGLAAGYEMKVGGALVRDEATPLAGLGVGDGAAVVVLSRRRRPAR